VAHTPAWPRGRHGLSVRGMDEPTIEFTEADLELLLADADGDDRLLSSTPAGAEPRESLDSQILAGLVSP
jgi:hypothetical protein